jgi:hypothetical protein
MQTFITAEIGLIKIEDKLEGLGIEPKQVSTYYPIHIRLSSIAAIYPIPDIDGIPRDDYAKVNVNGIEYVIVYSYKHLKYLLNI